jgi:hypothetical protein
LRLSLFGWPDFLAGLTGDLNLSAEKVRRMECPDNAPGMMDSDLN